MMGLTYEDISEAQIRVSILQRYPPSLVDYFSELDLKNLKSITRTGNDFLWEWEFGEETRRKKPGKGGLYLIYIENDICQEIRRQSLKGRFGNISEFMEQGIWRNMESGEVVDSPFELSGVLPQWVWEMEYEG